MGYENGGEPASFDADSIKPGEQGTLWAVPGNGSFAYSGDPHNPRPIDFNAGSAQESDLLSPELYYNDDPGIGYDISREQSIGGVAANGARE